MDDPARIFRLEHITERHEEEITVLQRGFFGNGNGNPGMVVRMDRMEQRGVGHSKMALTVSGIIAAVIAVIGQVIVALIK